jgi:hypothetical protein
MVVHQSRDPADGRHVKLIWRGREGGREREREGERESESGRKRNSQVYLAFFLFS